ncbi:Phosphopantetheine attachment site [compost metagenome]
MERTQAPASVQIPSGQEACPAHPAARRLLALWQQHCGEAARWQQPLAALGADSVQQLALLAALNQEFAEDHRPLTLRDIKAHGAPGALYHHWLERLPEEVL